MKEKIFCRKNIFFEKTERFINSDIFICVPFLLALISNFFGAELLVYFSVLIIGLFILLFNKDTKPAVPFFVAMYFGTSAKNSPISNKNGIYQNPKTLAIILIISGIILIGFIVRIIIHSEYKKFKKCPFRLWMGLVLLGISFCLNGLMSPYQSFSNFIFGLIEFFAISLCYFYFVSTIEPDSHNFEYFCKIMMCMGLLMVAQLAFIYATVDGIIVDGTIRKNVIMTGWGIQNNIGGMMALSIPFGFSLAARQKRGYLYFLATFLVYIAMLFTLSRTSIFVGSAVFVIGIIYLLIKFRKKLLREILLLLFVGIVVGVVVIFKDEISDLFVKMTKNILTLGGRKNIFMHGVEKFIENPIFGAGFYSIPKDMQTYDTFLPERYHNMFIQVAASCGCVGLVSLLIHMGQVLRLWLKKINSEKTAILCGIVVLWAISMLDNHIFNLGPGLIYSIMLCFLELMSMQKNNGSDVTDTGSGFLPENKDV